MKRTTLAIEDRLFERIKEKAAAEGRAFQDCANELLKAGLDACARAPPEIRPLPEFPMGEALIDVSDRDAIAQLADLE